MKAGAQAAIDFLLGLWSGVVGFFEPITTALGGLFRAVFDLVLAIGEFAVVAVQKAWTTFVSWIDTTVVQPVIGFFTGLWATVSSAAQTALDAIVAAWTTVTGWIDANVVQPIRKLFADAWGWVSAKASDAAAWIQEKWQAFTGWLNSNVVEPIRQFFAAGWKWVSDKAGAAADWIQEKWQAFTGWIDANVVQPIRKLFADAWTWISERASWASGQVSEFIGRITGPVERAGRAIRDGIGGAFQWVHDTARRVVDAIAGWIDRLTGWLRNLTGNINGATNSMRGSSYVRPAVASTVPDDGSPFYMTAAALLPQPPAVLGLPRIRLPEPAAAASKTVHIEQHNYQQPLEDVRVFAARAMAGLSWELASGEYSWVGA